MTMPMCRQQEQHQQRRRESSSGHGDPDGAGGGARSGNRRRPGGFDRGSPYLGSGCPDWEVHQPQLVAYGLAA